MTLIIEVLLGLKSKKGDVTVAFIHAEIPQNENVHIEIPRGFEQFYHNGHREFLKPKKTLYGLRQSLRFFWKYLTKKLEQSGPKKSKFDP